LLVYLAVSCELGFAVWAGAVQNELLYLDQSKGNWREKEESIETGRAAMRLHRSVALDGV
jgi:hypothetical protein